MTIATPTTPATPNSSSSAAGGIPLLELNGLSAGYGAADVVRNIDLHIDDGEIVVVLGANGAGKTTMMRAIASLIPHKGHLAISGQQLDKARPDEVLQHGVGLVPQGRGTLASMSVRDNLRVGGLTRRDGEVEAGIQEWIEIFPSLGRLENQVAGTLSGGEQQMLAVARAMMAQPRLLMCDEISLGLAPIIVQQLFDVLVKIRNEMGTALLMVEQNAELALDIADRVYLLEVGEIVQSGPAAEFRDNDAVRKAYLGY